MTRQKSGLLLNRLSTSSDEEETHRQQSWDAKKKRLTAETQSAQRTKKACDPTRTQPVLWDRRGSALVDAMDAQRDELVDCKVLHAARLQALDEFRRDTVDAHRDQLVGLRMLIAEPFQLLNEVG